jgi:hypothetical protein
MPHETCYWMHHLGGAPQHALSDQVARTVRLVDLRPFLIAQQAAALGEIARGCVRGCPPQ